MRRSLTLRWICLPLSCLALPLAANAALHFPDLSSEYRESLSMESDFLPEEMEELSPSQIEAMTQDAPAPASPGEARSTEFSSLVTPASLSEILREMADPQAMMYRMPFLSGMAVHSGRWSLELAPAPIREAVNNGIITEDQARFSFEQQKAFYEWTQENPARRYLFVNVPTFDLALYSSSGSRSTPLHRYSQAWSEKAIVGRDGFEPSEKSLNVVSLKYNPTWTPTASAIRRNALTPDGDWNWEWIDRHRFVPHSRRTQQPITWVEATHMPLEALYFVEPPGPQNTLGEIKFETDSKRFIYLHDTNTPWYFDRNNRAISTGCVRVADPRGLAAALLEQDTDYVASQINTGDMFWERIETVPFYFMYDIVEYGDKGEVLGAGHDPYGHYETWLENTIHHDMSDFDYEVQTVTW